MPQKVKSLYLSEMSGNQRYPITRTPFIIGRTQQDQPVDLDLGADLQVSRQHARITEEDGHFFIEDLSTPKKATNGSFLDDVDIRRQGKQLLKQDALIRIGAKQLKAGFVYEPDDSICYELDSESRDGLDLRDSTQRLQLLYELPIELGQLPLDQLVQKIVERLLKLFPPAARSALMLLDDNHSFLLAAHEPSGNPAGNQRLSCRAIDERKGFIWERNPTIESGREGDSYPGVVAGMYAPLFWQDKPLGVLCVDNELKGSIFQKDDLRLLLLVAQYAAMAVANHQLQQALSKQAQQVERLLTNFSPKVRARVVDKPRLGGQISNVTLLMSDIRGYTKLSAKMSAQEIVDMLNFYFTALIECIFKFDGTVDKFIGDAILAVFGSPEPDANQHENAVRAAWAMQEAMTRLNQQRADRKQVTCEIGIGVHSGEVLHGFIGSEQRLEFTVIGDAVNRTARYCDGAQKGEVLISADLYKRVYNAINVEKCVVKTKHEGDFEAFRLKGFKPPPGVGATGVRTAPKE